MLELSDLNVVQHENFIVPLMDIILLRYVLIIGFEKLRGIVWHSMFF